MKVSDCMTRNVRLIDPADTIQQAARAMAAADTGVLPVGANDRLVGIVTDRDIAIRAIGEGKGADAKVSDVMSHDVRHCYEDDGADDVLQKMGDLQVRRLPVLSRDKQLVGIISLSDLAIAGAKREAGDALGGIARPGGEHSQAAQ